jgi:hypothetical protein
LESPLKNKEKKKVYIFLKKDIKKLKLFFIFSLTDFFSFEQVVVEPVEQLLLEVVEKQSVWEHRQLEVVASFLQQDLNKASNHQSSQCVSATFYGSNNEQHQLLGVLRLRCNLHQVTFCKARTSERYICHKNSSEQE